MLNVCVVCVTGSHNVNMNMASIDKERLLAHLDETNPNTFEVEDLSRLIKRVCIIHFLLCYKC